MKDLIEEYRNELRKCIKLKAHADEHDSQLLGSAISDLRFAIEWMETGFKPGARRGVERLSSEQREIPFDPMNAYYLKRAALQKIKVDDISPDQRDMLQDLLHLLTEKEREAFRLVRGSGYSFQRAADLMHVHKATVQKLVARAEIKINFVIRKPPNSESIVLKNTVQRVMFV